MIGLSHNTHAPVEVRERLAFTMPGALPAALDYLKTVLAPSGAECVLLSTCNRTELYVAAPGDVSTDDLVGLLVGARRQAARDGASHTDLPPYLEERRGHRVIEHLFRVAAGLDSMVLGENDITRQIKTALSAAREHGACAGGTLFSLFHDALRVGKRARTETDLARGAFSIGHAAAQLAQNIFGSLQGRQVLLLGAGKMSETTARHLAASGASSVLVANRTFDRAARLAEALNGRAVRYDEFPAHLAKADIVIASTAAPHPVLHRETVEAVLKARRHRPLFLIDIAVPRDIDADVGDLPDVFLYDIDDLQAVVDADLAERRQRAAQAETLVHDEAMQFAAKLRTAQAAVPLVSSVRAKQRAIIDEELERLRRQTEFSPEQWAAIEQFLRAVENKTLHNPTLKIKEYAAAGDAGDAEAKMETVRELFGLAAAPNAPSRDEAPKP
jgi:glutamyl-tRNA reductase